MSRAGRSYHRPILGDIWKALEVLDCLLKEIDWVCGFGGKREMSLC